MILIMTPVENDVRFYPVSGHSAVLPGMTASVKGCRTSAVAGCYRHPRSAGVGQASMEETAGSLGSAARRGVAMGIFRLGGGFGRL